jgi:hypothetical protein
MLSEMFAFPIEVEIKAVVEDAASSQIIVVTCGQK